MANPNAQLSHAKDGSPDNGDGAMKDDPNIILHLLANSMGLNKQAAGNLLAGTSSEGHGSQSQVRFNKKLLDFDYGEDDDDENKGDTPTEAEPPGRNIGSNEEDTNPLAFSMAQNLLLNPELLEKLKMMQANMHSQQHNNSNAHLQAALGSSSFVSSFQPLGDQSGQGELQAGGDRGQHVFENSDNNFAYNQNYSRVESNNANNLNNYGVPSEQSQYKSRAASSYQNEKRDLAYGSSERRGEKRRSSRSPSPRRSTRFSRPDSERGSRGRRSRSRSPSWRQSGEKRSHRSPSRQERAVSPESKERDRENDRRRRGLPPMRKGFMTICSTTLWLGHVPKLVSEADISNAFGEFGTINSIDVGSQGNCRNKRQGF